VGVWQLSILTLTTLVATAGVDQIRVMRANARRVT
jgi:hypothetical protein